MKTYRYLFVLVVVAVCSSLKTYAQNIQTASIEWNCTSTFTAQPGDIIDEITKVVSSDEQIIWYDAEDNVKLTLSITGSEGTWSNVSSNGSILFKVNAGTDSGIVQFSKAGGVTRIRIHLVKEDEAPIYELTVSTVNAL